MNVLRWLAIFLLFTFSVHAEEAYEVRLHRPVKAGERFKLLAKVGVNITTKTTINADDVTVETLVAGCKLTGEVKVIAATPKGLLKELRYKITEAVCMEGGDPAKFFKPGDVIHVRHDLPYAKVEVNGEEPTKTQDEIIDCFLYVHGDESATDDELVGTTNKVKPGETWAMNREAIVADWARDGFEGLKPEHVSGSTKLVKLAPYNEQPGMSLEGEFKIENSGLRLPDRSEDIQAKKFKLEIKDRTELPLDPTAQDARVTVDVTIESDSSRTVEEDGEVTKIRQELNHRSKSELTVIPVK